MARVRVLGVEVDPLPVAALVDLITTHVRDRRPLLVANHNLHSAHLVRAEPAMQRWYDLADVTFVDGMSLVAASRLTGGALRRRDRATVLDWMPQVLAAAARDDRAVYHLGGDPGWVELGAQRLRERHPGLRLRVHHGFFRPEEAAAVVDDIRRSQPDLLLVGMGMPRQERWAAEHVPSLGVPVVATVGAYLGYVADATRTPPRWMGRVGLEWAYRLAADPRRLAHRYLVEPLVLARELARERRASAARLPVD